MNWFELYLLTRLEGIQFFAFSVGFVLLMVAMIAGIAYGMNAGLDKGAQRAAVPWLKKSSIWGSIALFFGLMIPSEKDLAIIIAGHWATNSEEMKQLPDNVAKTLNSLLDKANEALEVKK